MNLLVCHSQMVTVTQVRDDCQIYTDGEKCKNRMVGLAMHPFGLKQRVCQMHAETLGATPADGSRWPYK